MFEVPQSMHANDDAFDNHIPLLHAVLPHSVSFILLEKADDFRDPVPQGMCDESLANTLGQGQKLVANTRIDDRTSNA
jgi:hypothetical protein